ncbi:MAG TPA: HD domain-containing phosphohydrolase [Thermoanaerobaculia bacterium]
MQNVASLISAAVNVRSLYPANHPRVAQSIEELGAAVTGVLERERREELTFILIGDDLLVGEEVIRVSSLLLVREFIQLMQHRGIERLTIAAGFDPEEIHDFIGAVVTGEGIHSTDHLIVGRAHVVMDDEADLTRRELSVHQLEIARESWARYRVERRLPIEQLEELVWSLIDSLAKNTRSVLPLAELKAWDEYTFVHSVNVALLVLAQARSFGIEGLMLHEFGMAAMLHDAGKLHVPLEVLNKPGTLTADEWIVMRSHPFEGAWSLGGMENAPSLAVVVAFEHHLRFDGRPNYPVLREERIPNLVSRMTAIADGYDAMSTVRPYQKPLGRAAACEVLRRRAGTFYDPMLVGSFLRLVDEGPPPAAS